MLFKTQYIVIDDFYDDPDEINALARSLPTEDQSNGNYAGVMTSEAFYTETHAAIFKTLSGGADVFPSSGFAGKFRFSTVNDKGTQHIHFDPGMNQIWSGVVYLQKEPENTTKQDLESYGTHFWKHNRTGLTSIPLTQEGIEKYGWKHVEDLKMFLDTEGVDESLWTKTFTIPYKYNRLVLFRPWLFHSPGAHFGTDKSNCRLIQTFFIGLQK